MASSARKLVTRIEFAPGIPGYLWLQYPLKHLEAPHPKDAGSSFPLGLTGSLHSRCLTIFLELLTAQGLHNLTQESAIVLLLEASGV